MDPEDKESDNNVPDLVVLYVYHVTSCFSIPATLRVPSTSSPCVGTGRGALPKTRT